MADRVHPDHPAVDRDSCTEPATIVTSIAVPGPRAARTRYGGAGEADHPVAVGHPGHGQPDGRVPGPPLDRSAAPADPVDLIRAQPLRVRRDQHPACRISTSPPTTTTSTGSPANVAPTA